MIAENTLWLISEICKKCCLFLCLVYVNCRYMSYLIFAVSRICTKGYFMVRNQNYIR